MILLAYQLSFFKFIDFGVKPCTVLVTVNVCGFMLKGNVGKRKQKVPQKP